VVPAVKKPAARITLGDWLKHAIERYRKTGAALGQVATNAHDEALYLLLRTLALPLDSDPAQLNAWLPNPAKVKRVVDVCTGSGCLAILLAHHFPKAQVDAVDLSPDAIEVARINVKNHRLTRRVKLHESDVFDAVPKVKYDVILSNPPYEPSAHCDKLPAEFHSEPRMALDGGKDGLDVIRKLLRQARERLQPHGVVLIEVGGLQRAMDREFAALDLYWMHTADGCNCVCLIQAERLKGWKG